MLGKLSKTFGSSSKSSAASDSASDDGSFRGGLQAGPQTEEQVFWVDHLTPEQTGKLTELRASLVAKGLLLEGTHLDTDTTLLRFLKARGWNLAKAEAMYTAMVAWRRSFGTDDVYENFEYTEKDAVLKVYPQFYCGVDRFGRPVYVEKTGLVNAAELAKHTTVERLVKFHIKCYEGLVREKFPICSKLAGREIYTTTTILDLEGLSISQFYKCKDALKAISNTDQVGAPLRLTPPADGIARQYCRPVFPYPPPAPSPAPCSRNPGQLPGAPWCDDHHQCAQDIYHHLEHSQTMVGHADHLEDPGETHPISTTG